MNRAARTTVALGVAVACIAAAALGPSGRARAETTFPLSVSAYPFSPAGSGTISSRDGKVNCGVTSGAQHGTCTVNYSAGTSVTIDVSPTFDSDACERNQGCRSGYTLTFTMDTAYSVWTYGFKKARARIEVHILSAGAGTVTGTGGISCPDSCAVYVPVATQMSLSAQPAIGSTFMGWDSDSPCGNPTSTTCAFQVSDDWAIYATFGVAPTPSPGPTNPPTARPTGTPVPTAASTPASSHGPSGAPSAAPTARPSAHASSPIPPPSAGPGPTATPVAAPTAGPTDAPPVNSPASSPEPSVRPLDTYVPSVDAVGPTDGPPTTILITILLLFVIGAVLLWVGLGVRPRAVRRDPQP